MRFAPLLLSACVLSIASSASSAPVQHCPGAKCEATIIIPAECGSGIQVAPNPIKVPAQAHGGSAMSWVLRSKGWRFQPNGIEFAANTPFAKGKLATPAAPGDPPTFELPNQHTGNATKGTFKYDIKLLDPDGKPCQVDPTVINQ